MLIEPSNIEVLSFGKNGWSTKQQLQFLKKEGWKYQIDLLIVGFVTNDPDLGNTPRKNVNSSKYLAFLSKIFPNSVSFISAYIDRLVEMYSDDYGYENWEKKLYTEENLNAYQKVLTKLSNFCQARKMNLIFVFTPNTYDVYFKNIYDKMIPIFQSLEIEYLNLYPAVYNRLHTYNKRKLWANPANAHPGELVTSIYADEVFKYLTTTDASLTIFNRENLTLKKIGAESSYVSGKELLNKIRIKKLKQKVGMTH